MEGVRTWRKRRESQQAAQTLERVTADDGNRLEFQKAALVVEGYAADAGLSGPVAVCDQEKARRETESAATGFVASDSSELDAVIDRLARRHSGWMARCFYELLLTAMLGLLLFRLGKNFFYDSWWAAPAAPVFGVEFYLSAGFWLGLWCLLLLWAFCGRLRRGLRAEIDRLAEGWRNRSSSLRVFAGLEEQCRRIEQYRQDLGALQRHTAALRRKIATMETGDT
jgi:hypothetical protein